MKPRLNLTAIILSLVVLLTCVLSVQYANAVDPEPEDGLVARYKMDEGSGTVLNDVSGFGNNATASGSPTWVNSQAGLGLALNLNGTSQYATVPDSDSLDITSAITLSAWVKPGKVGTQNLIKKAVNSNTSGYELSLASDGTLPSSKRAFVRFNQTASGDDYRVNSNTIYPIDGNTWIHLAATYDGATIRLYYNGELENSLTASISIVSNTLAFGIGADSLGGNKLQGALDEVRVYNRALSESEIADLAELPPPPVSADLAITNTDGLAQTYPGDPVTYTIVASNNGPDSVTGATVTDNFPAALTGVSWTCAGTGGGVCSGSGTGNINDTVNLPVSGSVTYIVSAAFSASATGMVGNTASVAMPSGATDPNPANNTATDETFMTGTGDLSMVLQLKMNGDLLDSSVYMNDAVGTGSPTFASGKDGQAIVLNGTSQYATVPNDVSLNITNAITLAAWVKPEKVGTQYIIKKAIIDGTNGYELSLSNPGKAFVRFNQVASANTNRVDSGTSYPADATTWVHLAATYDGSTIQIYFNGTQDGSKPATFTIATNDLVLGIGAESNGATKFQGAMDEVRVYNRALTPGEIRRLANLCLGDLGTPDGDVDGSDLAAFIAAMAVYDPDADFNGDAVVNGADLEFVAGCFGRDDCP
jgi:large repetitive protein